mmetsp:Transcript_29877/g.49469  ORF Transcript_29877/g.49469 Transcript_29877/m.49469 type:complete len:205 (+) Transcript_29877:124-738(+)|eukprot:CAMPEP_0119313508 /NCGR_PEP_ID=MMETSP1333-20130426/29340_1 /TAXON_ID=418940 /ORGANISM="Scyphosphaera apsteinii, Strain RCC1455" /LENGTH=204 /DNA_ID=CAMNT_0007318359 /DNA_START=123 /DNA_END=737 /DNA_ORIENTATION=+
MQGSVQADIDTPQVLNILAHRGEEGLIGLDIFSDPAFMAWNVVVGIVPGSRAECDALVEIGDVIIEVDGVPLVKHDTEQGTSCLPIDLREVMKADLPAYNFKLLRQPLTKADSPARNFKIRLPFARPDEDGSSGAVPAARFDANSPREHIFEHAGALMSKHNKLARARGWTADVSTPRTAQASAQTAQTPRSVGRTESDLGCCV